MKVIKAPEAEKKVQELTEVKESTKRSAEEIRNLLYGKDKEIVKE